MKTFEDFEEEELDVYDNGALRTYVTQLLKGEMTPDEFQENIISFRNSTYYTGTNDKYKTLII